MKALLSLIALVFVSVAAPVEAQEYCGEGRWVNNRFVCPPTAVERIETELQRNNRLLEEQQKVLKEINRNQQIEASRPQPQSQPQQVIIMREPEPEKKKPMEETPTPTVPTTIYKWKDEKGQWHFSDSPSALPEGDKSEVISTKGLPSEIQGSAGRRPEATK